ncbi:TIM-barrel domain-containing protein [Paenibacillus hodogayensis]|uniref:TIM-barrel domain-containing protein n=1 Tax=Paenibacillus hodogayensis TaxID=279208 RepID=A0ABV5W7S7_9BACL
MKVTEVRITDKLSNSLQFELHQGGWVRVSPVSSHTFRIQYSSGGTFSDSALIRYGILKQSGHRCPITTSMDGESVVVRTEECELRIALSDGQFTWCGIQSQMSLRTAAPPWSSDAGGFGVWLVLSDDESIYGMGDVAPDRIERRGQKVDMWVAGTNYHAPIPFVMSSRGWALLMNTTWKHTIDIGCQDSDQIRVEGPEGELDFYLYSGKDYGELLNRYTDIAGKPRLLPLWAYGMHYYCTAESGGRQVLEDALKFRQEGIPCDLIGLADGWMDPGQEASAPLRWDTRRLVVSSQDMQGSLNFIDTLHRHGFKLSLSLECNYDLSEYEEQQVGVLSTDGNAPIKSWFDYVRKFVSEGVDSFKVNSVHQTLPQPARSWMNGMHDNELHNLYPLMLGKQMYNGYRSQTRKRPMIHAVVGYTGMQQFTATESGKYGLRATAVVSALNSGLSGHVHTAIHIHVDTPEGIHAGFLQPWAQSNSGRHFRHPCFLEHNQRNLFRMYAKLRYRLLPYLYSAAHHAALTGMPIARAMPLMFPGDSGCRNLFQQFMLGDYLLVAVFSERVYLPEGRWIDYWTGDRYVGPATIEYRPSEHAGGPLFVRAGAILPMWPDMEYVGQRPIDRLLVHIYPYEQSDTLLYEDDGESFQYEVGEVAVTRFLCDANHDRTILQIWPREGAYANMPERRSYEILVHSGSKPASLHLNGERCPEQTSRSAQKKPLSGWKYDRLTGIVRIYAEESLVNGEPVRIELSYAAAAHKQPGMQAIGRSDTVPSPIEGNGSAAVRRDSERWLHIALDTCRYDEVSEALNVWWSNRIGASTGPDNWRVLLLEGCLLIVRHAERRGWSLGQSFGIADNPLAQLETKSPEEGLELLRRLAREVIAAAIKTSESVGHPVIREVITHVQQSLHKKLSLQELADQAGFHPVYLSRLFKKETGLSFTDYVMQRRMERAKALLESGMKVYEAASLSGFADVSHFSRIYSRYWGRPPVSFRRK